jgi:predicted enzyme related to lactoylglutathione lyase
MSGRIVHFEIPFDDGDRARAFYSDVFGWKTNEMAAMQYTMAMTGPVGDNGMPTEPGFINGGMFQRTENVNVPVVTIDVDSIDDALEKVEANGGKTVEAKIPVGDMGFAAYFNDSEGNLVGLWQSAG